MAFLTVRHTTTYTYKQPVAFGEHRLMFRPRDSYDQRLVHVALKVTPSPASVHWTHDVFGNCVACVRFTGWATRLEFETVIELEHRPMQMLDFRIAEHAEVFPFSYDQEDVPDLLRSIERQYPDRNNELSAWAKTFTARGAGSAPIGTLDVLDRITQTIRREFTYVRREEMGIQPPWQMAATSFLASWSSLMRDFTLSSRRSLSGIQPPAQMTPAKSADFCSAMVASEVMG